MSEHHTSAPDPATPPPAEWTLPRLSIDVDGDWFHDDVQVTHPGIVANLRSNLRRDAQGYFIQTRVRIPVTVADAPWVITRAERRGDALIAQLNDGTEETLDPAALRIGGSGVPYATVKGGAFVARFGRAAAYQLLSLADYDERSGRGILRLGRQEYELVRAAS
ncbi:MAG: DUF1285 domain-containing protein [Candidatus Rokubacteria bacterium]|nr:DUF1285 domain-containing protein [Candidatus Rokubacteria bacterium]